MAKSHKNLKSKTISESTTKGRLVELIVASLHQAEGVEIQRNVKIPPKHGSQKRRREIDVLISTIVVGYPFKIAIECKNYKKIIGVNLIDEFRGKLEDAGLSPQQGIFVTSRRYTKDAVDRAQVLGIRLLSLSGLTADRMASEIMRAVHSVVHLLLKVREIVLVTDCIETRKVPHLNDTAPMMFCNEDGVPNGAIPHELWARWVDGHLSKDVGEHTIKIPVSPHWFTITKHSLQRVISLEVKVRVVAHVVNYEGKATSHALWEQPQNTLSRFNSNITIDFQNETKPVYVFDTETELLEYMERLPYSVKTEQRFPLPRIWFNWFYWPLSERMDEIIGQRIQLFQNGEIARVQPDDPDEFEGTDLSTVWEPVSNRLYKFDPVSEEN